MKLMGVEKKLKHQHLLLQPASLTTEGQQSIGLKLIEINQ